MNKELNSLPQEVINEVKQILKAYDEVTVIYENGKYNVTTGICLKAKYPDDYKVIGRFKANEVFTKDEQIVNYMESFHEYHPSYKGERDYRMLKDIKRKWDLRFELKDGNLVIKK